MRNYNKCPSRLKKNQIEFIEKKNIIELTTQTNTQNNCHSGENVLISATLKYIKIRREWMEWTEGWMDT